MANHTSYRGGIKEVRIVFEGRQKLVFILLSHINGKIEPGGFVVSKYHRTQRQPGEVDLFHGGILQDKHDLEQRRRTQITVWLQLFNQLFERQILVCERPEGGLSDPCQQLPESGVATHVRSHNQIVYKKADQRFRFRPIAPGDRSSDDDIVLPGVPVQQRLKRRDQRHEKGGICVLTQLFQRIEKALS